MVVPAIQAKDKVFRTTALRAQAANECLCAIPVRFRCPRRPSGALPERMRETLHRAWPASVGLEDYAGQRIATLSIETFRLYRIVVGT